MRDNGLKVLEFPSVILELEYHVSCLSPILIPVPPFSRWIKLGLLLCRLLPFPQIFPKRISSILV